MAGQKIYTTYRAPVESFPLGAQRVGLLKPGRYNGFNTAITTRSLGIVIEHTERVMSKTDKNGDGEGPFGTILMPTGIVIHQYDPLYLSVEDNLPSAEDPTSGGPRLDILVCEHNYAQVPDGAPATFFIIKGTRVAYPSLPDPTRQIIVGRLQVRGNFSHDVTIEIDYIPEPAPFLGDMEAEDVYGYIESQVIAQIQETAPTIVPTTLTNTGEGIGLVIPIIYQPEQTEHIYEIKGFTSPDGSISISGLPTMIALRINVPSIRAAVENMDFFPNQAVREGNVELVMGIAGKRVFIDPAGNDVTVTIPNTGLTQKYNIQITQFGAGTIRIVGTNPVDIVNPHLGNKIEDNHKSCTITRISHLPNTYIIEGDLIEGDLPA